MFLKDFKVRATQAPWRDTIDLHFIRKVDGRVDVIENIIMRHIAFDDIGVEYPAPISLPVEVAQGLMDTLWQCGIRPTEGSGSAGSLRATENHLSNLQKITDRLLSMVERTHKDA